MKISKAAAASHPLSFLKNASAIFWDIDGTLFSSQAILHSAYIECFEGFQRQHGRPAKIPTESEIMQLIGQPTSRIFARLAPELSLEEQRIVSNSVLQRLVERIEQGEGVHYEGARETLLTLAEQGYHHYAASNGRLPYVRSILTMNRVISCFREVEAIDGQLYRNKSDLILQTLTRQKLHPSQALLVGDRATDRDAADDNGIHFIAATYGHGAPPEWEGAVARISHIRELLKLLDRRQNSL